MSSTPERSCPAFIPLHEAYLVQLREHAVALIWMGYGQLNAAAFATADEDSITGELVRHIRLELERDDAGAPPWLDHYSVSEQVRSDAPGKLGKSRPIVDIQFERVKRGVRPLLRFEAKRLGRGAGVTGYLGEEGLGAFLTGHYSRTHNEAGMLGYLQTGDEAYWARKLGTELRSRRARYRVTSAGHWRRTAIRSGTGLVHQTEHTDETGVTLVVLHLLLDFTGRARQTEFL